MNWLSWLAVAIFVNAIPLRKCIADSPDDFPFVNRGDLRSYSLDETFSIPISGNKDEIDEIWGNVMARSMKDDTITMRMLLEDCHHANWTKVSDLDLRPLSDSKSVYCVDSACDYIELRLRQDFWGIDPSLLLKKSQEEINRDFSVTNHKLFSADGPGSTISCFMKASTTEYQIIRDAQNSVTLSLPKRATRQWPNLVDIRTIGIFSFHQWTLPTSLEQWKQVMPQYLPVNIERSDSGLVSIKYFASGGPIIRSYLIDTNINRILEYVEYPVKSSDNPFEIICPKVKTFHNKMRFDRKGNLIRFVMGLPTSVFRGEILYAKVGIQVPSEYFAPRSMCNESSQIVVDSSILEYVELLKELEVSSFVK